MVDPAELRTLFDQAASLPPLDRAAFLARECGDNLALRREVERLLACDAQSRHVLSDIRDSTPSDAPTRLDAGDRLALGPGARLGPYEVVAPIGAGGMGEVYRARDTRLDRTVALKVLPAALTEDPVARQRFEREARAIAALTHPHICPLFDIGRHGTRDYLVMEFEAGETLAARLARGKLSLDEAVGCASQIAEALAAAHRAGIVHRDLKPGNVMLTPSGVKLLDFGLAKYRPQVPVSDATAHRGEPLTGRGVILGTVRYMAPEQLQGQPADERTDVFAFGVVLHEMLTGRHAFDGPSDAAVIGNILHADPPSPSSAEHLTPAALDALVHACLAKMPAARPPTIADASSRLVSIRSALSTAPRAGWTRPVVSMTAAVLLVAAVAGVWWLSVPPADVQMVRSEHEQHDVQPITLTGDIESGSISQDGRFVAYVRRGAGIWMRQVASETEVRLVPFAAGRDFESLTFTPDGNSVDFAAYDGSSRHLWRVPLLGGTPRRVLADVWSSPSWSPDGRRLAFIRKASPQSNTLQTTLVVVDANGANERVLAARSSLRTASATWAGTYRPAWSPDGRRLLIADRPQPEGPMTLLLIDASTGDVMKTLTFVGQEIIYEAAWLDDRRLLLNSHDFSPVRPNLWVVDPRGGRQAKLTRELADYGGISLTADRRAGVTRRAEFRSGLWVGDGQGRDMRQIVPNALFGANAAIVDTIGGAVYGATRGDGTRVLYRLAPGATQPVVLGERVAYTSATSPDGRYVVFSAFDGGKHATLNRVNSDGTGVMALVARDAIFPTISPDGATVLYVDPGTPGLHSVSIDGGPTRRLSARPVSSAPSFSPDGRRLLFYTDELGTGVVCDWPDCSNVQERRLKSAVWAPSGKGVAYVDGGRDHIGIYEQPLDDGTPRELIRFPGTEHVHDFSWSADYKRLVVSRGTGWTSDLVLLTSLRKGR